MGTSTENEIRGIHRWPLLGALSVVLLTLLLVIASAIFKSDEANSNIHITSERMLYFLDGTNGQVVVYDAKSREKIANFKKGEGAFIRISMRSLMRQRTLKEIDHRHPFKLVQTSDGNLSITDPKSDVSIRVNAFGPIATQSFAQFLPNHHSAKGAEG